MHYRLLIIFLVSLLFGSFSMNLIHYDAYVRAEQDREFNEEFYPRLIEKLHTRLCEVEE
jgi:hypothetical protein